VNRVQLRPL